MTRARDVASNGGLTLITSNSFTTQSSISINNCFSSTYDNYKILFDLTSASASSTVTMRLLANGTASTASYYYGQSGASETATTSNLGSGSGGSTTYNWLFDHNTTYPYNSLTMEVISPYLTKSTKILHQTVFVNSSSTVLSRNGSCQHSVLSSYDGIQFNVSSGNITGIVKVYGYRN